MRTIRELITKRDEAQKKLEDEAVVFQKKLKDLVPTSLSKWKAKNITWILKRLTESGSIIQPLSPLNSVSYSFSASGFESLSDVKDKFEKLSKAWKGFVEIAICEKGTELEISFKAS